MYKDHIKALHRRDAARLMIFLAWFVPFGVAVFQSMK